MDYASYNLRILYTVYSSVLEQVAGEHDENTWESNETREEAAGSPQ